MYMEPLEKVSHRMTHQTRLDDWRYEDEAAQVWKFDDEALNEAESYDNAQLPLESNKKILLVQTLQPILGSLRYRISWMRKEEKDSFLRFIMKKKNKKLSSESTSITYI